MIMNGTETVVGTAPFEVSCPPPGFARSIAGSEHPAAARADPAAKARVPDHVHVTVGTDRWRRRHRLSQQVLHLSEGLLQRVLQPVQIDHSHRVLRPFEATASTKAAALSKHLEEMPPRHGKRFVFGRPTACRASDEDLRHR